MISEKNENQKRKKWDDTAECGDVIQAYVIMFAVNIIFIHDVWKGFATKKKGYIIASTGMFNWYFVMNNDT